MRRGRRRECFQLLIRLVENGIPDTHVLVFTTGTPDRRKKIYKLILEHGLVVDCSVATGARKADIEEQQAVLRDISRQMLLKTGKQMAPDAFAALVDQTGFNPELFANAIEKLLAYTGGRNQISVADIGRITSYNVCYTKLLRTFSKKIIGYI